MSTPVSVQFNSQVLEVHEDLAKVVFKEDVIQYYFGSSSEPDKLRFAGEIPAKPAGTVSSTLHIDSPHNLRKVIIVHEKSIKKTKDPEAVLLVHSKLGFEVTLRSLTKMSLFDAEKIFSHDDIMELSRTGWLKIKEWD